MEEDGHQKQTVFSSFTALRATEITQLHPLLLLVSHEQICQIRRQLLQAEVSRNQLVVPWVRSAFAEVTKIIPSQDAEMT